jgi:streptogramin lyase
MQKRTVALVLSFLMLTLLVSPAASDTIEVVAGGGTQEAAVGMPATNLLGDFWASFVDRDGYLYLVKDHYNSSVTPRGYIRVNPWGVIDKVFTDPVLDPEYLDDITVDGAGNVYLPMYGTGEVYKITPCDSLALYHSVAPERAESLALDPEGNLYVSNYITQIVKVDRDGVASTHVSGGRMDSLYADGWGNVYFTEGGFIKKADPSGNVTTLADENQSHGITGDVWGNIYYTFYSGVEELRRMDAAGSVTTVATLPSGGDYGRISADSDGMVYISQLAWDPSSRVYKVTFSPEVHAMSPTSGYEGDRIVLSGRYFGSNGTGSSVTLSGVQVPIENWTNETVVWSVPQGAVSGDVVVHTQGGGSNPLPFTVLACTASEVGLCNDGIDNDCDGLTDTEDVLDCPVIVCSDYTDKSSCNAEASCRWINKDKICVDR